MSATSALPIPAGWYPDPLGTLQQRWWNGNGWTREIAPYKPTLSLIPADPYVPPESSAVLPAYSVISAYGAVQAYPAEPAQSRPTRPFPAELYFSSEQSSTTHETTLLEPDFIMEAPQPFAYETIPRVSRISPRVLDRPTQRYTASIWLLAVSPLLYGALSIALSFGPAGLYSRFSQVSLILLAVAAMLTFAIRDRRQLSFDGHVRTATPAWLLLTPLAYLLARAIIVKRQTGLTAVAPLILGILVVALLVCGALLQPSTIAQVFVAAPM
jgi:Protein of unknown function (DUF2510)